MDIQRDEAFEEAYSNICKPIIARPYPRNENGEYFYKEIHEAHLMWQAAKASVAEGFVSIEDRLPWDGQEIIAFDAINNCVFENGEFLQEYYESDTGHVFREPVEVTHWKEIEAQEPSND